MLFSVKVKLYVTVIKTQWLWAACINSKGIIHENYSYPMGIPSVFVWVFNWVNLPASKNCTSVAYDFNKQYKVLKSLLVTFFVRRLRISVYKLDNLSKIGRQLITAKT